MGKALGLQCRSQLPSLKLYPVWYNELYRVARQEQTVLHWTGPSSMGYHMVGGAHVVAGPKTAR